MVEMTDRFKPSAYLAPRHWATWIGLGLLRLLILLPYRLQLRLGAGLGGALYYLLPRRRRIARINLALCFPQLAPAERRRLLRRHFRAVGMTLLESPLSWWASDAQLRPLAHIQGLEHLRAARARGKGVILLSAHFVSFELCGRLLSMHEPFQFMYKRQRRNPLYEALTTRARLRHFQGAIAHDNARAMIRALKKNLICWYLPDQDKGRKVSVFAPFMGVPTATVVAPMRMAKMTGAAVVPYVPRRRADGSGYDIVIQPPLEGFPSGDDEEDAARINRFIEEQVRQAPEQYLWLHRRFRTRPQPGEKVYD